ncbi:MAG: hypothetical protein B7Z37_04705 [Verrucomicrobia bacterium 12-59-8]|nr:MAG: hypothetical protein B7Z37_04705 [Verrucomicrobia bacterium 12-59-8]
MALFYTGSGETSNRQININGTAQTVRIAAEGSGALVLTNLTNVSTGRAVLDLRGFSNDANMITSTINDSGGALQISKNDGGTWLLTGNNTYSGGTQINSGFLGLANTAGASGTSSSIGVTGPTGLAGGANNLTTITLGSGTTAGLNVGMNVSGAGLSYGDRVASIIDATHFTIVDANNTATARTTPNAGSTYTSLYFGSLLFSNGGIYSTNGPLTINQPMGIQANAAAVFAGPSDITLNGIINGFTSNPWNITNTIGSDTAPGTLTINSQLQSFETTTARNYSLLGTGNTIFNGSVTSANAATGITVNLLNNLTWNPTTNTSSLSSTVSGGTTVTVSSTAGLYQGMLVTGTGIPANTTISAITSGTTFTLSQAATNGTNSLSYQQNFTNGFLLNAGNVTNTRQSSVTFGTGALTFPAGTLQSTVDLSSASGNALLSGLQLSSVYGVFSGTSSFEFRGNATLGYSLQNNGGNRAVYNNLSGGAALTFSTQPVNLSESASTLRVLTLEGPGTTNISSVIQNFNTTGGNSGFTYSGTGALNLTANNTFTGAATLNGGTTTLSGANGAFGYITTLTTTAANTNTTTLNIPTGTITQTGFAVTGPGIGPGITISTLGGGTATLSAAATVASGVTVYVGGASSIVVGNNATLTLNNTAAAGGNFTGGGGGRLGNHPVTLNGGTLNLQGNASTATTEGSAGQAGSLTLNGGQSVINLVNNGANVALNFNTLTLNGGSTLNLTGGVGVSSNQLNIGVAKATTAATTTTTVTVASTAGLVAGQAVIGANLAPNTTIASITNGTQLVLSTTPLGAGITSGQSITFGLPETNNLSILPRVTVGGTDFATTGANGLQAFTGYVGSGADLNSTVTGLTVTGITTTASTTVTGVSTTNMVVGQTVVGTNIPQGATVASITGPTTFVLSSAATAGSGTIGLGFATANTLLADNTTTTSNFLNTTSTINALKITDNGTTAVTVGGLSNSYQQLVVASGGILVTGTAASGDTLSVPRLSFGTAATEGIIQVNTGSTLNLNSIILSSQTGGVTKGLGGNLNINKSQYYTGNTTLNGGTTTLNGNILLPGTSTVLNTLFQNQGLIVNNGATLDLNGSTQWVSALQSTGQTLPGQGGTVTSTVSGANLIAGTNAAFAGTISGTGLNFTKIGNTTMTFEQAQTYTGATNILGGTFTLRDSATLLNTSAININYATLTIDNNANLATDMGDRVSDTATITLNGGFLNFNGRTNSNSSETVGAVIAAQGANSIQTAYNNIGNYALGYLTLSSLSRNNGATVNFISGNNATNSLLGNVGGIAGDIFVTGGLANNSTGALGAWAIVDSNDYAGYNVSQGVGAVGTAGYQGYAAGYSSGGTLFGFGTDQITNVQAPINQALTLSSGGASTGMLRLSGNTGVQNDILFAGANDVLNLVNGGLLRNNISAGSLIGNQTNAGILTAGTGAGAPSTTELVIYNANTTTASGIGTSTGAVNGSTTLTLSAVTATVTPGMIVTGTGIAAGTYVTAVSNGTTTATITLSNGATANASGATYTFTPGIVVNSSIRNANTAGGYLTELVKSGAGALTLTNTNTYTGGTVVNQGTLNLASLGTAGVANNVVIPYSITNPSITLNNASLVELLNQGQINSSNSVTLNGSSNLTLVGNNTLNSLTFNNNGGVAAPTVTPAGVLTLTSSTPVTVTSNNAAVTPIISAGTVALAAGVDTFNIGAIVTPDGAAAQYTTISPSLNITSVIQDGSSASTLLKTGAGLLQLSGQNLFTGGVNLNQGGLMIGANSTPITFLGNVANAVVSGPLGSGTLNIAAGTYLAASAASTLNNTYQLNNGVNGLNFKGTFNLTLNGTTTLNTGITTVNVEAPQMVATLGGVISDGGGAGSSITKTGNGTLALTNNNTITGGAILNEGTLLLGGFTGSNVSPLGTIAGGSTPTVTINGGLLSLQNNGAGNGGLITYTDLTININPSLAVAGIFVGNNGANLSNTIEVPNLTIAGGQILNVSNGNNYQLRLDSVNDGIVGSGAPVFNPAAGTTILVLTWTGDKPVKAANAAGSLIFPDIVTRATSTALNSGDTIQLDNGTLYPGGYYPLVVQAKTIAATSSTTYGLNSGGLSGAFTSLAASTTSVNSTSVSGIGFSGSGFRVAQLNDTADANRPAATSASFASSIGAISGFINITSAGNYTFRTAADDGSVLYIDGVPVVGDAAGAHALTEATPGIINLAVGLHSIVYKPNNQATSGGYRVVYSGADTGNSFQPINSSNLYYANSTPTAGNAYSAAAIINNPYALAASSSATIDTFGTQIGAVANSLNLGNSSALTVVNGPSGSFGPGYFGIAGTTTLGTGVVVNPGNTATSAAGVLNLIGNVSDSANGLIKTGSGMLILGGSNTSTFTGQLKVLSGFVQISSIWNGSALVNNPNALPAGGTIINNGNANSTTAPTGASGGTTLTLAGSDTTTTLKIQVGTMVSGTGIATGTYVSSISGGVLTLSQALTAAASGTYNFSSSGSLDLNGQTGVLGNVTINGVGVTVPSSAPAGLLAAGSSGALWNSSPNAASLAGILTLGSSASVGGYGDLTLNGIAVSSGTPTLTKQGTDTLILNAANTSTFNTVVSLGTLKLNSATALGAAADTLTISSGAVLDLNGQTLANTYPITVSGAGYGGAGTISGVGTVSSLGAIINTSNTAVSVAGTITLGAATSIGSNYVNSLSGGTVGGNITLSNVISGAFALTKVGSNTLTLQGNETFTGGLTIAQGTVIVSGASGQFLNASGGGQTINAGAVVSGIPQNTLTLDNTSNALSTRLGSHTLTLNGGSFNVIGNASTAVTDTFGTANLSFGAGYNIITLTNNGASVNIGLGAALTRTAGATALIRGTNFGATVGATSTNLSGWTTAPTAVGTTGDTFVGVATNAAGIIPYLIIDTTATGSGTSFATYNATAGTTNTNGLQALSATNYAQALPTVGTANGTSDVNLGNFTGGFTTLTLTNAVGALQSTGINSLTLNAAPASGNAITIAGNATLSIDSGGILATTSDTIGVTGSGRLGSISNTATQAREFVIWTAGSGTTLTLNAALGGAMTPFTGGLTKSGAGTLVLSAAQNSYTGNTIIDLGTVKLAPSSTTTNDIFYRASTAPTVNTATTTVNASSLTVNASATLDLNGNNQVFGNFTSAGNLPGTGGIITNSSTTTSNFTVISTATSDWAGQINGSNTNLINFTKSGSNILSFRDQNGYYGTTTVQGSVLSLIDQGTVANSSEIDVFNSVLRWDDSGIQAMTGRVNSSASIVLDGGAFTFISRSGTNAAISLGNLYVLGGSAMVNVNIGNTGLGTASATFNSLAPIAFGSTLTFGTSGTAIGAAGNGSLGDNPNVFFTSGATNTNGILGGAFTVVGNDANTASFNAEFATYDGASAGGTGVRALAPFQQTTSFASSTANSNLRLGANAFVNSGGQEINSLTLNGGYVNVFFQGANDTLTLQSGGLLAGIDNAGRNIGVALSGTLNRGKLTADASQSQLYIHNGANFLTIQSAIIDNGNNMSLVLDSMSQSGPTVVLANANTYLGATFVNGVNLNLANTTGAGSAILGDVILTGGTNNGFDSLAQSGATMALLAAQQLATTSNVTVRNGAAWNLNGFNSTVANLTFNSQGGDNGGNGPLVYTGTGVLSLTGGITSTNLSDLREIPAILGFLNLAAATTVSVDAISTGNVGANSQIGLTINSNILSSGTITITGAGVLGLGGVSYVANTVNFDTSGATLVLGPSSNYGLTSINTTNGTLDMRGLSNLQVQKVTGTGTIKNFNTAAAGTLTVGGFGTNSASFAFNGALTSDYSSGALNITKIGTGTMTLGSVDNSGNILGTLLVGQGTVQLNDATAREGFAAYTLNVGGTLLLDSSTNVLSNRLGGNVNATFAQTGATRSLTMQGGTLVFTGGASAVTENIGVLTIQNGGGVIQLNGGIGGVNLSITALTTTGTATSAFSNQNSTGTLLIQGAASSVAAGNGTVGIPTGNFNVPGTQGGGANGTFTMSVRPDILVDASATGTGTGFAVLDSVSRVIRPLQTAELLGSTALNSAAITGSTTNVGLSTNTTALESALFGNVTANSLTLLSGSGFSNLFTTTGGNYGAGGLLTVTLNSGGLLALGGSFGSGVSLTSAAVSMDLHVTLGNTLTLTNAIVNTTAGIIKADDGTLIFGAQQYFIGGIVINGGTLAVATGTGANTILVNPTGTVPTVNALAMNGASGVFELNGNNQAVGSISSINQLPNLGGTIQNSGSLATLTTVGASSTFGGQINGAINLIQAGTAAASTLTLTGTSAYSGSTLIMSGLILKDAGQLSGTSGVTVNYSALTQDNTGLAVLSSRIPGGATLNGGSLIFKSLQGNDSFTVGAITPSFSANTITVTPINNSATGTGSTQLTIASLGAATNNATINFSVGSGTLGAPLTGITGITGASSGSNTQMYLTSAPTLTNGIIGPWAIVNGADFATYLAPGSTAALASGAAGIGALGLTVNSVVAQQTNGSNVINVLSTAPFYIGEIINGLSGLTNPTIIAINSAANTITVSGNSTASGSVTITSSPFGNYSANALTAGVLADNITVAASVGAVTSRTINSLRINTAAATTTMNTLGDTLTIGSGGLLQNFAGVVNTGGLLSAGTTLNTAATLYDYANATATISSSITNNSLNGVLTFVKSGSSTTTLNVLPTVWTTSTTSASNTVTVSSTAGLAIGQIVSAGLGQTSGAIITGITDATRYTISANVGTGSATAAGTTFGLPTSQVLNLTTTSASNTITVPAGTILYPGMTVTVPAGNSAVIPANTTVLSVSGNTVTLSAAVTTGAAGPLLFSAVGAQTVAVTNTSGTNTLTLATATGLNVGQLVTGTGVAANTFITGIAGNSVTLSANTTAGVTSAVFSAIGNVSQITSLTSGSSTAVVPTSLGLVVGQPVQGAGIPQGTTVASIIDATHITLSTNATATTTGNAYYGLQPLGVTVSGTALTATSTTVTVPSTVGLAAGQSVNGVGIAPGTTIASITDSTHFVLSTAAGNTVSSAPITIGAALNPTADTIIGLAATTTANSATVTVASTNGLYVGMPVTGNSKIPANEFITAITSATTFTITTGTGVTAGTSLATNIGAPAIGGYSNQYTGQTVVDQGTLTLGGALGSIQVPGDLLLNGGNVTETTNAGQIASTSNVTINGFGTLTLVGSNTLATLTFNGTGGSATPTVTGAAGNVLVLTGTTNAITSTNDNLGFTPTISTLTLELNGANRTITTSGASPDDLIISAPIVNTMGGTTLGGLIKEGSGSLILSNTTSTFNGGLQLNNGSLIFAVASTQANGVVTAGPMGIGTLTIGDGTTLLTDGTTRIVANAVTVNGNFTFGGGVSGNNLALGGSVILGSTTRSVTVANPAVTGTLGGTLGGVTATGGAGLTKLGAGILSLGSAGNNWTGATTVSAGVLQFGATQVLASSAFIVAAGAELNINAVAGNIIGSLAGDTTMTGGLVTNSGAAQTLTLGADGSSTTFAGAFTAATAVNLALTKIGAGTMTLTGGLSNATGALILNQGAITLSGNGAVLFGSATADTLNSGGTLNLDNSGTALNNRLSTGGGGATVARGMTINGGTLTLNGGSTAVTETLSGTFTVGNGGGTIKLTGTGGQGTTLSIGILAAQAQGGGLLLAGDNLATAAGAGNATVSVTTFNTLTGQGTGANGTTTMAIRSDIIADNSATGTGTGFLVKDSVNTNTLRPMTTAELATTLSSSLTTNFGNFSAAQTYSSATSLNSLTLNTTSGINATGGGQAIQGSTVQRYTSGAILDALTINTGGILATANSTLNVGSIATTGNAQFEIHVTGTSTLNVNGFLLGTTGGLTKNDGGTLSLNNAEYYTGTTTVNAGTLFLNSGLANTIVVTPTATIPTVQALVVNGGTLDLNGQNQAVGTLSNNDTVGGTGGTVTSSITANFISSTGTSSTFGGIIGGSLNFYKEGTGTLTLTSANNYSGTTNILGGAVTLQDSGTLASTTINLGGATLNLTNNVLANNNSRISSSALINLNNGTFVLTGANYVSTNVTIGSSGAGVTLATGANAFTVTAPALATGNMAVLNIGNLTRTNGATVVFTGTGLGSSVAGSAQQFVTSINSLAPTLVGGPFTVAGTGAILGGWATAGATAATADNWATLASAQTLNTTTVQGNTTVTLASGNTSQMVVGQSVTGTNFAPGTTIATITGPTTFTVSIAPLATSASFSTAFGDSGIVALNAQDYINITAAGTLAATTTATGNYSINAITAAATITLKSGGNTINSLQIAPGAAGVPTLDLNGGALVITSGGILRASTNSGVSTIQNGTLTAGTGAVAAELFFNLNNTTSAMTVSAVITDNNSKAVSLVKTGAPGVNSLLILTGNNSYSGGTYVDSGTLTLSTASANGTSIVSVPGNLTINNGAAVNFGITTANQQIATSSNVTINGGGSLTLPNYSVANTNTLASLTFNNSLGGTATPTVAFGTPTALSTLILTAANAITSSNDNFATTPSILAAATAANSALQLSNVAPVITVSGLSADDLIITAPITSAGGNVKVTGGGSVVLSGASTFTTGVTVDTSTSVIFGANSAGTPPTVTSGPVGTGALTLNNGSTILSDGTIRTIGNATSVQGDFTFGGTVAGNGVILSGVMSLAAGAHTITVTSPLVTDTISGKIQNATSAASVNKAGAGTLVFTAANTYTGSTTVSGGVLQVGVANAIPSSSAVIVNAGAALDIKGFADSVGSLAGDTSTSGGMITNSGAAATLTTGNDNTSTTFAGVITNAASALNLVKLGAGTQTLSGANSYTGTTTVNANGGTLQFAQEVSLYNNAIASWTAANVTVNSGATVAFNVGGTGEFTTADTTTLLSNLTTVNGNGLKLGSAIGFDTSNAAGGSFAVTAVIKDSTGTGGGAVGVTKLGANTLVLNNTETYTGPTTVTAGILQVGDGSSGSLSGTTSVTVSNSGTTLSGSGSISGSTIINTGAILAPGVGNTNTSNSAMTFTAAGTALQVNSGGHINLSLTASSQFDAGFDPGATNAVDYLNGLTTNGTIFTDSAYVNNWKTAGSGYDSISLTTGSFKLGTGTGTVTLIDNSGTYTTGEIFKLLDWSTLVSTTLSNGGGFTTATDLDLSGISLGSGMFWDTSAFQTYGIIVVVPEPSRMLMLMFGLLGLFYSRRRRYSRL